MYQIIDTQTNQVVGTVKTATAARRKVNKLDLEHGSSRYTYKFF